MDCACQGAVVGVDIAEPGLLNAAQSPAQHDTDLGIDLQQGFRGSGEVTRLVKDGMVLCIHTSRCFFCSICPNLTDGF